MADRVTALPPRSFYGVPKLRDVLKKTRLMSTESQHDEKYIVWKTSLPLKHRALLGPSQTWRVFKKQQIALEFARVKANELMTFVYQESSAERVFLVAHPTVFWYYDITRSPMDRCSFEIIPEFSVCKLYFDLEFDKEFNCGKDGVKITETFIKVVNCYLERVWGICINRRHILDLDSTSEVKFSRHLIYQLPGAAFRDNHNVGSFVKTVCSHLRDFIFEMPSTTSMPNILEDLCYRDLVDRVSIKELLVFDNKGNQKIFCDEAVYTRNRHFRLLGSTKRNKNSPLTVSPENQYKSLPSEAQLNLFLDSLISYFPAESSDLTLLEHGAPKLPSRFSGDTVLLQPSDSDTGKSPHPAVDNFISSLVTPGRISRWFYFSSSNRLVYTIIGFRYCNNIGRQHRSNGIQFVVNLTEGVYYQKCFDPDCTGYRSNELKLPAEIGSLYNQPSVTSEDIDTLQPMSSFFGVGDEDLSQVLDAVEHDYLEGNKAGARFSNNFPTETCKSSNNVLAHLNPSTAATVPEESKSSRLAECQFPDKELSKAMIVAEDFKLVRVYNRSLTSSTFNPSCVNQCGPTHFSNDKLLGVLGAVERSQINNMQAMGSMPTAKKCSQFTNDELLGVLDSVEKSQNINLQTVGRPVNFIANQHRTQFTAEELIGVLDAVEKTQYKAQKSDINLLTKQHKLQFTDKELIEAMDVVEDVDKVLVNGSQSSLQNNFDTDELMQMMDSIEKSDSIIKINGTTPATYNEGQDSFPEFGISDSQLLNIVYPNM